MIPAHDLRRCLVHVRDRKVDVELGGTTVIWSYPAPCESEIIALNRIVLNLIAGNIRPGREMDALDTAVNAPWDATHTPPMEVLA